MEKDIGNTVNVGSVVFDLPNGQDPRPHFKAYYGNTPVPCPCNHKAMQVNASKVMKQTMKA